MNVCQGRDGLNQALTLSQCTWSSWFTVATLNCHSVLSDFTKNCTAVKVNLRLFYCLVNGHLSVHVLM